MQVSEIKVCTGFSGCPHGNSGPPHPSTSTLWDLDVSWKPITQRSGDGSWGKLSSMRSMESMAPLHSRASSSTASRDADGKGRVAPTFHVSTTLGVEWSWKRWSCRKFMSFGLVAAVALFFVMFKHFPLLLTFCWPVANAIACRLDDTILLGFKRSLPASHASTENKLQA